MSYRRWSIIDNFTPENECLDSATIPKRAKHNVTMQHGAIILCGGHSSRMGRPKWSLPFGPETMLARIARLVGEVCEPIVVVKAAGQEIPTLPLPVLFSEDRHPDRGPLEGLAAGLRALPEGVLGAYVTGCDVPLLVPDFVRRMFALLGEDTAAVPVSEGYLHPLAAVYRTGIVDVVDELLASQRLRPTFLFDCVATRRVEAAELRDVDPRLDTLRNLNSPADYLAALTEAGFTAPPDLFDEITTRTFA